MLPTRRGSSGVIARLIARNLHVNRYASPARERDFDACLNELIQGLKRRPRRICALRDGVQADVHDSNEIRAETMALAQVRVATLREWLGLRHHLREAGDTCRNAWPDRLRVIPRQLSARL